MILASTGEDLITETAAVILSNSGPKTRIDAYNPEILPEPDLPNLNVQADLNGYY